MNDVYFNRFLEEIYSNFGRTAPTVGSPMYKNLHRRICEGVDAIPDEAAGEIAYAFSEYDSLPMNLGKAIRAEFSRWRANHPERVIKRPFCPNCNSGTAGWCYAHDADGKNYLLRCTCNATDVDPTAPPAPVATEQYLREAGLTLGHVVNPRDTEGTQGKYEFLSPDQKARFVAQFGLGKPVKMRAAHMQAREDAGASAWEAF